VARSVSLAILLICLAAGPAAAQSPNPAPSSPGSQPQDSAKPTDEKKPKKTWTNENISDTSGPVSVVGDAKDGGKAKSKPAKPADAQYIASARKQLEKYEGQIADYDKQIADLKNFSRGEPSTSASGIRLSQYYNREPIEVQIRALEDKKKDLRAKIDALLDEARKKGVEPGDLR
jgi:hypothetical protein